MTTFTVGTAIKISATIVTDLGADVDSADVRIYDLNDNLKINAAMSGPDASHIWTYIYQTNILTDDVGQYRIVIESTKGTVKGVSTEDFILEEQYG